MPTYEYRCPNGHLFDKFQRMSDPPEAACPECGADAERQLSAGAGLLFKGSGFYITDYRSDSYKKAAESDAGGGSSGGKSSDAGSSAGGSSGGTSGGTSGSGSSESKPAPKKTGD